MPRQAFVEERVVRSQQVQHAAILTHCTGDKQLRFPLKRLEQTHVEMRVRRLMGNNVLHAAQIQPLGGEIFY